MKRIKISFSYPYVEGKERTMHEENERWCVSVGERVYIGGSCVRVSPKPAIGRVGLSSHTELLLCILQGL